MRKPRTKTVGIRFTRNLTSLVAALCIACVAFAQGDGAPPQNITIVSGVSGGSWYPIGAGLAEILSRNGTNANTEQGGGVSNVIAVSRGDAELGFTPSIIPPLAKAGLDPFPEPIENIRGIAVLWQDITHVMVREDSGIKSIADLHGVRFASQPVGTSTAVAFANVLEAYGLTEDDLTLTRGGQSHGVDQVKDRNAVGLTATTAAPSGTLSELAATQHIRILGVDDAAFARLQAINGGFVQVTLPAGTYLNQAEDVKAVGAPVMLITREELSEENVYWITKTLVENIASINAIHGSLAGLTPEKMAAVPGIPLHPGAERYYREVGLIH